MSDLGIQRNLEQRSDGDPARLAQQHRLTDGTQIVIRPIRPDDDPLVSAFLVGISAESGWKRLLSGRKLTAAEVRQLTRIDYAREMAFIAVMHDGPQERELGAARYVVDEDGAAAEFALLIADAWQHKGIGTLLLQTLIEHARGRGLGRLHGITYATNRALIELARKLGCRIDPVPYDGSIREVVKMLGIQESGAALSVPA